jgi:hypothetical protein
VYIATSFGLLPPIAKVAIHRRKKGWLNACRRSQTTDLRGLRLAQLKKSDWSAMLGAVFPNLRLPAPSYMRHGQRFAFSG